MGQRELDEPGSEAAFGRWRYGEADRLPPGKYSRSVVIDRPFDCDVAAGPAQSPVLHGIRRHFLQNQRESGGGLDRQVQLCAFDRQDILVRGDKRCQRFLDDVPQAQAVPLRRRQQGIDPGQGLKPAGMRSRASWPAICSNC